MWECADCGRQTSLTAGTVLEATKLPLTTWFWAAFVVATDRRGLSAYLLQRQLDLGNINSAWFLLHKLRRAMVNANRTKLSGLVEIDGTYVGGYQPGRPPAQGPQARDGSGGRRGALQDLKAEGRHRGDARGVGPPPHGGRARRERRMDRALPGGPRRAWLDDPQRWLRRLHGGCRELGYAHERKVQGRLGSGGTQVVPLAHRAISNLKTWLTGTHHGVGRPHLQAYLDAFVFRFNRRQSQTLLGLGSAHAPVLRRTIHKAGDLPSYYEGDEAEEEAG